MLVTENAGEGPTDTEQSAFGFGDPRQAELYDLLHRLVGEGLASFYRDAYNHITAEPPMEALRHQVGHLVLINAALNLDFQLDHGPAWVEPVLSAGRRES